MKIDSRYTKQGRTGHSIDGGDVVMSPVRRMTTGCGSRHLSVALAQGPGS